MKKSKLNFSQILQTLTGDSVVACSGVPESADSQVIDSLSATSANPILLITADQKEAERFHSELSQNGKDPSIRLFPAAHSIPYNMKSSFGPTQETRLETLTKLLSNTVSICIASSSALFESVIPPKELFQKTIRIQVEDEIPPQTLINWLHESGFHRSSTVTDPGTYSQRGGILDIYPLGQDNPLRIEFWGDIIDSIRTFDIFKQRTIQAVSEAQILPMKEFLPTEEMRDEALEAISRKVQREKLPQRFYELIEHSWSALHEIDGLEWYSTWFPQSRATLFDYLPSSLTIVYNDYLSLSERYAKELENYSTHKERVPETQRAFVSSPDELLQDSQTILSSAKLYKTIFLKAHPRELTPIHYDFVSQPSSNGDIALFSEDLKQKSELRYSVCVYCDTIGQKQRLEELLIEHDAPLPKFVIGYMKSGFFSPSLKVAFYTEGQIFDKRSERRFSARTRQTAPIINFDSLESGDTVVHVDHGIAKYRGTEQIQVGTFSQDCMVLEYKDKARIHVPITDFHKVQKYIGKDSHDPTLSKLGSKAWEKKKERTRQLLQEMASKMAKLYAKREYNKGIKIDADTAMQVEFENSFIYTPTPDQTTSIEAIKLDMESEKPMDRLVCGDVGFGKTEVAMRAAFKAVMAGYQVAILAPTTVLATQHGHTFRERMSEFPINMAVLSRFSTGSSAKETLEAIAQGDIQIIIGTHKILSQKIKYNNLGLVIIDEEQRFGVKQKDRFTVLRHSVNVLSMSATPIPRTLHMSMAGIRDLSLINTAPQNRLPIETTVAESHDDLVQQALINELDRGGQAFVVLNRISGLDHLYQRLERLIPQAKIAVAHGQMDGEEVEDIMNRFTAGDYDILLSTTIIENGIDIPNANTIIIERADQLGLSQLYQLRGRVGRSVDQGYAYFLVDSFKKLNDQSLKRLKALEQYTDLGSGFQLAMRDLELRGAGNLLGTDQSGSIAAVGFELYCQLLKEEVDRLRDLQKSDAVTPEPDIKIGINGHFPAEYIPDSNMRIILYQRATSLTTLNDIKEFEEELSDRFGAHPEEVSELLILMSIKTLAKRFMIKKINLKEDILSLYPVGDDLTVQQTSGKLLNLPKANFQLHYGELISLSTTLSKADALQQAQMIKNILKQALRVTLTN